MIRDQKPKIVNIATAAATKRPRMQFAREFRLGVLRAAHRNDDATTAKQECEVTVSNQIVAGGAARFKYARIPATEGRRDWRLPAARLAASPYGPHH